MTRRAAHAAVLLTLAGFGAIAWPGSAPGAIAAGIAAPATTAAAAPSPDELVARALDRAPSLAALAARVREARELVRPAGALPAPMLELIVQDVGFPRWTVGEAEMSMAGPQLTQGIPFPGKRGARRRAARDEAAVRAGELESLRREVALDVRRLCARLHALDAEHEALTSGRELLELLAGSARERYAAGTAEQEAAVKAQLAVERLDERRDDRVAERAAVVAALDRYLDRPGDEPLGRLAAPPEVTVPPAPWSEAVLAGSPGVALGRAEVRAAESRLHAARAELRPDLVAGAGAGFRGGMDPVITLRLGLELPLWAAQSQLPVIRAAGQGLEVARASLRDAEAGARAQAARLEAEWSRSSRQVERYQRSILPQSRLAFDAARAGYLAGRGDFSVVVEDFNAWIEARTGLAQREAERYATWAELQALVGPAAPGVDDGRGR